MITRPLCQAENNSCKNLAEQKGKKRSGEQRYGKLCDSHRRKGHDIKGFRNSSSIRYIPLDKCAMCNEKAVDRHRIIPGSEYLKKTTVCLCKDCHRKVHMFYKEINSRGYFIS